MRTTTSSFLSYFSNTTPDSEQKRVRLKTLLFLQGSTLYDPAVALSRLKTSGQEKVLSLELAVLYGKVCCPIALLIWMTLTPNDA